MRLRRVASALLTVAAALCALPAAAQNADSVVLHFAWPAGIEGQIQYTQIIDREGDAPQPTHIEIEGEYTLHVHEHSAGLLIEHLEPVALRFQSTPPLAADDPRRLVYSTLGAPIPDYVVSPEGRLVDIQGLTSLASAVADVAQRGAPGIDVGSVVGQMANPAQLMNAATERWNNQVGDWVDAVLRAGEIGTGEGSEANPLIPTLAVPYTYRFQLNGIEPCTSAGGTCVRVEVSRFYDPEALNKTMNDALAQMGLTNLSFDGLAQESRVILLTDPNTLLTYQLDVTKGVEGILKEGGRSRVFRRTDQISLDYTYQPR